MKKGSATIYKMEATPKNYEFVGFQLYDRKPNETESAFTGDFLYYEIVL